MTRAEHIHKGRVAELGCAMCHHIHGPHEPAGVELHHLRSGGWGKGDYMTLIPLCFNHHRGREGIHHIGTKLWEREFGVTQRELLAWSLANIKGAQVAKQSTSESKPEHRIEPSSTSRREIATVWRDNGYADKPFPA